MGDVTKPCGRCGINPRNSSNPVYCVDCKRLYDREATARRKRVPQTHCSRCSQVRTGSHMTYCKACFSAWKAERAQQCTRCGKDRKPGDGTQFAYCERCYRDHRLMKTYGITTDDFAAMLDAQGGNCAICECGPNGREWHVDHCHETGRVRGILCDNCNRGIGHLKDSPILVRAALAYLER